MRFDYSKLRGRIREKYHTEREFAMQMGIGRVSLSQKFNNEVDFTQTQIHRAAELLGIKTAEYGDYFFTIEVQKSELMA